MLATAMTTVPSLWQRAASYTARAHRHQLRKDGTTPFAAHPFRVTMVLRHVFDCDDEVALAAALLHDTIEDTVATYDDIKAEFGAEIADCVAALTKNMLLPEEEREPEYDRRLAEADWRARIVKLADTYDNLCDATTRGPKKVARRASKCRRAIALAQRDIAEHDDSRRAIEALESLLDQVE